MNFKKKIAAVATAALCSLSAFSVNLANVDKNNVYAAGVTGKTAFQIAEDMTIGWNLGNTLDCANTGATYSTDPKIKVTKWGNPEPNQELFDAIKAGGFNTVRIPTTWYEHIQKDANGDWEISPAWMAYVKKTVDFAYNNDMYVILNVHHEDWVNVDKFTDETKAAAAEKLEDIWTQVAEEFKDYDQRLVFEGMNEPRQTYDPSVEWGPGDTYSWQYINDLNAIFVDVVRGQGSSANKERVLMLPGYVASSNPDTVRQIAIPEGSGNVALSVHAYLPYFFTMATDSYGNHEYKADGSSASGYGANYRQEINTFFSNMDKIQDEKNAPIIIGEFSASDFGNTESRINWAKDYMSAAEAAKIPCVLWDNNAVYTEGAAPSGENHGYINRKTNTWYENSAPVIETMMQTIGVTNYSLPVYSAQDFSWDNITIGSDWVELFKSTEGQQTLGEGDVPFEWGNVQFTGYEDYINEDYKIVIIAKSSKDPAIAIMAPDNWNLVMNDGTSKQDYVYNYSYADMKSTVEASGDDINNIMCMFASAQGDIATVYGIYAVPINSSEPTTTQPVVTTKVTTAVTTTSHNPNVNTTTVTTTKAVIGDKIEADVSAGTDGYTFTLPTNFRNELYVELAASDAVTFANGCVGISATYNGVDYWVSYNWDISSSDTIVIDTSKPSQISYNNGKDVVDTDDILLIKAIVSEVYSKNSGMVQVWWANDSSGEGIETSNVTVKSVYVIDNPIETTPVFTTTAYPVVTTTTTSTAVTTTAVTTEATAPSIEMGTPSKMGDVNLDGEVAASDIVVLSKFMINNNIFPLKNSTAAANADVTYDKLIGSADTLKLIEYIVGSITTL